MKSILAVVLSTGALMAFALSSLAAPSIIPLPVTMQTRPGVFTLGSNVAAPNSNSRATRKIFVDAASAQNGQYLAMMLSRSTGFQFSIVTNNAVGPIHNVIQLTTVNALGSLPSEGYELTVAPDSVVIRAPGQDGIFWGIQSLLQLFPVQIMSPQPVSGVAWTAQCVYIQDYPRFKYRGVMLDVARHFVDKQEVEKIMDGLALHKINEFHWHLNDDHGWRLELKNYPLLTGDGLTTNTGAFRTGIDYGLPPRSSTAWNSAGRYGGYYTQEDVKEVVAYATQRHINIVPEIEIPAHCSAALWSYPAWGCGNAASVYNMDSIGYSHTLFSISNCWPAVFTNILNEVCNLFPGPYIHCGGDETTNIGDYQWTTYAPDNALMTQLGISTTASYANVVQYQYYLSTNLAAYLQSKGRTMCGWTEIEQYKVVTNAICYEWETLNGAKAAAAGQQVVMCPNGINYYEIASGSTNPYATNVEPYFIVGGVPSYKTLSTAYNYDPIGASGITGSATNNIIGVQLNLWTENVPGPKNVEYKIFPRMIAESEVGWSAAGSKSFSDFTNRLWQVDVQRLAQMGMNYNHENIPQIGTWGPSISTSGQTATYDITSYVTNAGEIDVSFVYQSGADAANVSNFQLLENGTVIDASDTHVGRAGANFPNGFTQTASLILPYYITHLQTYHPGATYTIQCTLTGVGGTASNGKVYLPNWN